MLYLFYWNTRTGEKNSHKNSANNTCSVLGNRPTINHDYWMLITSNCSNHNVSHNHIHTKYSIHHRHKITICFPVYCFVIGSMWGNPVFSLVEISFCHPFTEDINWFSCCLMHIINYSTRSFPCKPFPVKVSISKSEIILSFQWHYKFKCTIYGRQK